MREDKDGSICGWSVHHAKFWVGYWCKPEHGSPFSWSLDIAIEMIAHSNGIKALEIGNTSALAYGTFKLALVQAISRIELFHFTWCQAQKAQLRDASCKERNDPSTKKYCDSGICFFHFHWWNSYDYKFNSIEREVSAISLWKYAPDANPERNDGSETLWHVVHNMQLLCFFEGEIDVPRTGLIPRACFNLLLCWCRAVKKLSNLCFPLFSVVVWARCETPRINRIWCHTSLLRSLCCLRQSSTCSWRVGGALHVRVWTWDHTFGSDQCLTKTRNFAPSPKFLGGVIICSMWNLSQTFQIEPPVPKFWDKRTDSKNFGQVRNCSWPFYVCLLWVSLKIGWTNSEEQ